MAIKAPDVERLTGLLAVLQANLGGEVKYISIYFDSLKKEHIAWFFCDIESAPIVEKINNRV